MFVSLVRRIAILGVLFLLIGTLAVANSTTDLRSKYLVEPVLWVPMLKPQFSAPLQQVAHIDGSGTVVGGVRLRDEYGSLEADEAFLPRQRGWIVLSLRHPLPYKFKESRGTTMAGIGWQLSFGPRWRVLPGPKVNDKTLVLSRLDSGFWTSLATGRKSPNTEGFSAGSYPVMRKVQPVHQGTWIGESRIP
ncbi:MAG: hypothetical protein WAJ85_01850, partial [Candidatus Baltobacteraceae bacterium]